jgi:hypothetical protein
MSIFDRFFKKKIAIDDSPIKEEIKLGNIKDWLNNELKDRYEKRDSIIKGVQECIGNIKSDLDFLEGIDFPQDTEPRIKTRVIGNISNYIRQARLFIEKIEPKEIFSIEDIEKYCGLFNDELNNFNKSSIKNFYLIQLMFRNEMGKIANDIKTLESDVKSLNELSHGDKFVFVSEIFNKVRDLESSVRVASDIEDQLKKLRLDEKNILEDIEDINKKIDEFKNSSEYRDYEDLEKNKELLEKQITDIKNEVVTLFSNVDRGLRKLKHIEESKIIDMYLESPLNIFHDKELKILDILESLKDAINTKKIDFNEKNDKFLENINKLTAVKLTELITNYNNGVRNIKEIEKKSFDSGALKILIDYSYKVNSDSYRLENIRKEIDKIAIKIKEIDLEDKKRVLESKILESIGKDIKII